MNTVMERLLIPAGVAFASAAALIFVRSVAFRVLHRWAKKTETDLDDLIIQSLKTPSVYWCIAIGIYIGLSVLELPDKYVFFLRKAIYVLIVLSVTFAASNLLGKMFRSYVRKTNLPIPTTG